jgi:hypothetical protein
MPEKTTKDAKRYKVSGKTFTWTTEDGATVSIPLRIKLGVIRKMADQDMDAAVMIEIVDTVAPGQGDVLDDMDVNDFTACFSAWQFEYSSLSGATLPE